MEGRQLWRLIPPTELQQIETQHTEGNANEDLVEVHPRNALFKEEEEERLIDVNIK